MRRFLPIAAILAAATTCALAPSATANTSGVPAGVACVVYERQVTVSDVEQVFEQARKNYAAQGQRFPPVGSSEYRMMMAQAVDFLVERALFERAAVRLGVQVAQRDVDERLQQLKDSFFRGDEAAYRRELRKQGLTEAEVKDNIRSQLLSERLFERVTAAVRVSEAQARRYFQRNRREYVQPESREVAHILVSNERLAWRLFWRIRARGTSSFHGIARRHSQDPSSAPQGGRLTVSRGQTVPQFDRWAFRLRTGGMSRPVRSQFGWHIILAIARKRPATTQQYRDVREQVRQTLEQEARSRAMQGWRDQLMQKAADNVACAPRYVWSRDDGDTAVGVPMSQVIARRTPAAGPGFSPVL